MEDVDDTQSFESDDESDRYLERGGTVGPAERRVLGQDPMWVWGQRPSSHVMYYKIPTGNRKGSGD